MTDREHVPPATADQPTVDAENARRVIDDIAEKAKHYREVTAAKAVAVMSGAIGAGAVVAAVTLEPVIVALGLVAGAAAGVLLSKNTETDLPHAQNDDASRHQNAAHGR
jgi:hypothetical protein